MPLVNGRQILIPKFQEDEPLSALKLNALCDALNKILNGSGLNSQVSNDPNAPIVQQMIVSGFYFVKGVTSYLSCRTWNGTTQGPDTINVALPYILRTDTWDGHVDASGVSYDSNTIQTMTATRSSDSTVENWKIIFPYEVGDLIYAVANVRGGIDAVDTSNNPLKWMDLNTDARAWAKV